MLLLPTVLAILIACGAQEDGGAPADTEAQEIEAQKEIGTDDAGVQEPGPDDTQIQLMDAGFQVFKEPVKAPGFTLRNLDGEDISLSSFAGKTVLLNFWATWCPPCRVEMPSMQRMYNELRDEGFELIAVDLQEPESTVRAFVEENDYSFPVLLDSDGKIGATYGARSIPQTYLIDSDGFAIAVATGAREWDSEEFYSVLRKMNSGN